MNWYRAILKNGELQSCELVDSAGDGTTEVLYVQAETQELAAKVALLLSARRKRLRAVSNRVPQGDPEFSPVAAASRLELLEEVSRAWEASETQAQFVKWLISEITKLKGPQVRVDPYAPQSSLSGCEL